MAEFHFLRPLWLLALIPLWLVVFRNLQTRYPRGAWSRVCDAALLPFVLSPQSVRENRLTTIVAMLAGTLAIVALAGPVWERLPVPVFRGDAALVIALDLSASMNAEDLNPSRLQRAKFRIADLLRLRTTGQTALVVYAAQSFVVTPLTEDTETLAAQLEVLDTTIMPCQGTNPAAALEQAAQLLHQAGIPRGHVLLITDGADEQALERAGATVTAMRHRVSVLGVGTSQGALIPDQSGGFLKNAAGDLIVSRLAVVELRKLANAGRGMFLDVTADDRDLKNLNDLQNDDLDADVRRLEDLAASQWREFGPWLLLPLLPITALAFRRGVLLLMLAVIAPAVPIEASAGWWQTPNQEAQTAFENGAYSTAAETFADDGWRGAAQYRAGAYEAAVETFSMHDDALAHFNRGNALARLERFDEAIAAYDQALRREPSHKDAAYNKALTEALLRQDPEPEQQGADEEPTDDDAASSEGADQTGGDQGDPNAAQSGSSSGGSGDSQDLESSPAATDEVEGAPPQEPQQAAAPEAVDAETNRVQLANGESETDAERAQATEQWLRQIPDEPGGLLRRKFQYQYERLHGDSPDRGNRW